MTGRPGWTGVKKDGPARMHADYNYDELPQWNTTPASSLYTNDLIKYPRDPDKMPDWLVERVTRAQDEYPKEYEVYEQAMIGGRAGDGERKHRTADKGWGADAERHIRLAGRGAPDRGSHT